MFTSDVRGDKPGLQEKVGRGLGEGPALPARRGWGLPGTSTGRGLGQGRG